MNGKKRCSYSNKLVGNKEVILLEYAIDYVRKMGYIVSNFRFIFMFLFMVLLLTNGVSAQAPEMFQYDLSSRANIVMLVVMLVVVVLLLMVKFYMYASFILMCVGCLLLFNEFNPIVSTIAICAGFLMAFLK